MSWFEVIFLGVLQGLTEFLPVSSSGHLRIASALIFDHDAGASFTAVTQLGTEAAVLVYFARDISRLVRAGVAGLWDPLLRATVEFRLAWYVVAGTIPISVLGYLLRDDIRTAARNLWLVAINLIVFGLILAAAEWRGRKARTTEQMRLRDGVVMGAAQALALMPGVSRSGGTISAGLFLGLTRETATRYSFLLAIPAVVASGLFSLPDVFAARTDALAPTGAQMAVATLLAFAVGLGCIAWLLRWVTRHTVYVFVGYRLLLGTVVLVLLSAGVVSAV